MDRVWTGKGKGCEQRGGGDVRFSEEKRGMGVKEGARKKQGWQQGGGSSSEGFLLPPHISSTKTASLHLLIP